MRIHSIFYISLLKSTLKNARLTKIQLDNETQNQEYKIKKILNK
jgi:hypothetical protein